MQKSKVFRGNNFREYDSFNVLDDFILNLLLESPILSPEEINKLIIEKLNISLDEETIYTSLFFMYVNGLVRYQRIGTNPIYTITEEGKQFLKDYQGIMGKIMGV